jgi:FkbM family methyltransferase
MSALYERLFNKVCTTGPKITGCIHIGAHWGQEYEMYKNQGIDNILFYEPLPHVFEVLKRHVGEGAKLRNVALGNKKGKIEMYVEDKNYSQSSSILEPEFHLTQYPEIEFVRKQVVDITTLDDEISDDSMYNFINIDVQGYELEVLKGSVNTLKKIDYIVSEINGAEMYKGCVRVEQLDRFLKEHGFYRYHTEWHNGMSSWGDAIYCKKDE